MKASSRPRSTSAVAAALLALLATATIATTASIARADDAPADDVLVAYRDAVDRGTAAFRVGSFTEARAAFERAYAIHAEPVLLFDIASCWRRSGDVTAAIAAYRSFLEAARGDDERRPLAEKTIAQLQDQLSTPAALPRPTPPAPPPRDDAAPTSGGSILRPVGLGVVSVGVVGLLVGGVEAARAYAAQNDLEALPMGHPWSRQDQSLYDRGQGASRNALIFGISGAVTTVVGLTLYFSGRSDDAVRVSALPNSGGGQLVLTGSF